MFYKAESNMIDRPDLNDSEKILLIVLDSLQQQTGYCYATNAVLAKMLSWDDRKLRRCLSDLVKRKFIECTYVNNRDRQITVIEGGQGCPRGQIRPRGQKLPEGGQKYPCKVDKSDQEGGQIYPPLNNREYNRESNKELNRTPNQGSDEFGSEFLEVEEVETFKTQTTEPKDKRKKVAPKKEKSEVVIPWGTESFLAAWNLWKQYKKEQHRFTYKGSVSEQAALKKLTELSQGYEAKAIDIINNAISSSWQGLHAIPISKNNHNGKQSPVTEDLLRDIGNDVAAGGWDFTKD